jgi:hypothetical protein
MRALRWLIALVVCAALVVAGLWGIQWRRPGGPASESAARARSLEETRALMQGMAERARASSDTAPPAMWGEALARFQQDWDRRGRQILKRPPVAQPQQPVGVWP